MEELANIGFSTFISAWSWYPVILGPRQIFTLCEVGVNPWVLRLVYNWYETGPYYLKSLPVWCKGWYCLRWYQIGMLFHTSKHTNTIYPCSSLYTTTNTPNVYYSPQCRHSIHTLVRLTVPTRFCFLFRAPFQLKVHLAWHPRLISGI
jgi:hypothetical protein